MWISSGEGERRAQRGYVPQYQLAAKILYQALASGQLKWVGLADRGAGSFDDVVLGLTDRISAYQVKTSRDPEPFSIETLLLGAQDLLGRMLEARRKLRDSDPGALLETIYVCDDYPRTNDNLGPVAFHVSSAAFLRAHEAHRLSWELSRWRGSEYGPFVNSVQERSRLDDVEFELCWRNSRFIAGGRGQSLGFCLRLLGTTGG